MSHEQATEFAHTFQEFCARIYWDDATNGLYLQLFGVDLQAVAAARGLPLPGRIRSWVRILAVPYVTAARIQANARVVFQEHGRRFLSRCSAIEAIKADLP
ncbi:hypothetical protein PLESTM_001191000 [Pleodorina starrii]|nr:hypothetical protein PLESTM_001191000 [Pleodorina starrii]